MPTAAVGSEVRKMLLDKEEKGGKNLVKKTLNIAISQSQIDAHQQHTPHLQSF